MLQIIDQQGILQRMARPVYSAGRKAQCVIATGWWQAANQGSQGEKQSGGWWQGRVAASGSSPGGPEAWRYGAVGEELQRSEGVNVGGARPLRKLRWLQRCLNA